MQNLLIIHLHELGHGVLCARSENTRRSGLHAA
jgi:hypothetical protein